MSKAPPPSVPALRVQPVNDAALKPAGDYVLYWMTSQRRTRWNYGLQRAFEHGRALGKPVLVFEALRIGYRWASDRIHHFVIEGMATNSAACSEAGVRYFPYVERKADEGSGLLEALAERACVVVADEFPCFFLPRMIQAAGAKLDVLLEQVDGNGIVPLRATPKPFSRAHDFRRWLQKNLTDHLLEAPVADTLGLANSTAGTATLPRAITDRWPAVRAAEFADVDGLVEPLDIDHSVRPSTVLAGGEGAAAARLADFIEQKMSGYGDRNEPHVDVTSGLSPLLHFGHVSAHEIVAAVLDRENWTPDKLASTAKGSREGWWGMSAAAEGFLDQVITWRELGYAFGHHNPETYADFESLPDWAQKTLSEHEGDPRNDLYTPDVLEDAKTHDELWNAAQRQLVREGRMHNYLRMLWGKKILEWSPDARSALQIMIELNNKYALDGRNPNSYSGIFWVLGRFDRAWGPERPIYGKIRYMSSDNTRRKLKVKTYLATYAS